MQRRPSVLAGRRLECPVLGRRERPYGRTSYQLSVVTDRPAAIYRVGEKVRFLVTLEKGRPAGDRRPYFLHGRQDGMPPAKRGTLMAGSKALVIEDTLAEPGVLHCTVSYRTDAKQQPVTAVAGAAFSPSRSVPACPCPTISTPSGPQKRPSWRRCR